MGFKKRLLASIFALTTVSLGLISTPASAHISASAPSVSTCGSDASASLSKQANASSNKTINLPKSKCYLIKSNIFIHNVKNLTINGNGATFVAPAHPAEWNPLLELFQDTNLKIDNVHIIGGYNGENGGAAYEGIYGIVFEADNGVTFSNSSMKNIQGDFLNFRSPFDTDPPTGNTSTNVNITSDTFTNAGYHGLTVESVGCYTTAPCNGLTVSKSTFTGVSVDAMDFEYDNYSSCVQGGVATWAAENYITIEDNRWVNWNADWLASIQGQNGPDSCNNNAPGGVAFQHLQLLRNTLDGSSAIFEVVGTPQGATSPLYWNSDWVVAGNSFTMGNYGWPYRGDDTVAGQLYFIHNLTLIWNHFPLLNTDEYLFDWDYLTGNALIGGNNFTGAKGIQEPKLYNTGPPPKQCSNSWGVGGNMHDAPC
jgi:hypothetical protein